MSVDTLQDMLNFIYRRDFDIEDADILNLLSKLDPIFYVSFCALCLSYVLGNFLTQPIIIKSEKL